jgi:hypothetical protein
MSALAGIFSCAKAEEGELDKYVWGVIIAVAGATAVSVPIGLKYSEATLLFGLIAALSAPVVIHRVSDKGWSLGLLVGLSIFASFPLKKLLKLDGFLEEMAVSIAYVGILWVIGFGWRRSWR